MLESDADVSLHAGARQLSVLCLMLADWFQQLILSVSSAVDDDSTDEAVAAGAADSEVAFGAEEIVRRLGAVFRWMDTQFGALDFSHSGTIDASSDGPAIYGMLKDNAIVQLWDPLRQAFEASGRLDAAQFAPVFLHWLGADERVELSYLEGAHCARLACLCSCLHA